MFWVRFSCLFGMYLHSISGKLWILLQNMWSSAKLYSLPLSSTSKRGNFHLNVSARRNRSSRGEAIVSRGQKKRASTTAVLPFFNTIPRLLLRLKANFVGRAHFVLLSSFSLELRAEPKMIQLWKVLKSFVATFGFALSLMMTNNVSQQVLVQNTCKSTFWYLWVPLGIFGYLCVHFGTFGYHFSSNFRNSKF